MALYDKLLAQAKELNVPTNSNVYKPQADAWHELQISEYELHRRIKEELRNQREQKLWMVAVISAGASVVSALTALAAILK